MNKNKDNDITKIDILDTMVSITSSLLISRGTIPVSETLTVPYNTTLANTIRRTHVLSDIAKSDLRSFSIHVHDRKKCLQ